MNDYLVDWKNLIRELNSFSSSVEFLQSSVRDEVVKKHSIDVSEYLQSLKTIVGEHENKLINGTERSYGALFIQPDASVNQKEYVV